MKPIPSFSLSAAATVVLRSAHVLGSSLAAFAPVRGLTGIFSQRSAFAFHTERQHTQF
jgi:hypothetical protein